MTETVSDDAVAAAAAADGEDDRGGGGDDDGGEDEGEYDEGKHDEGENENEHEHEHYEHEHEHHDDDEEEEEDDDDDDDEEEEEDDDDDDDDDDHNKIPWWQSFFVTFEQRPVVGRSPVGRRSKPPSPTPPGNFKPSHWLGGTFCSALSMLQVRQSCQLWMYSDMWHVTHAQRQVHGAMCRYRY